MAYRRDDIERVRAATDLVELVAEVTKVRRSGRNAMAVCPFHQEKTPSMSIDPARGLYHCFGCGNSGDLFRFVEQSQGLGFNEAVELLARRAGIVLTEERGAARRRGEREGLIGAVEEAVEFYHARLRKADDAAAARAYLRGRGYEADVVERYRLGYAPDTFHALVGHLRDRKVGEAVMVKAGLASRARTGRLIDRFRGRVLFPIYDLRGDAVGFGARLLEGEGPKYLNSPESPIYHKSRLLYGLNWAKSEIVRSGFVVVVEGYTDVIALQAAGLPVAVATCGTALGEGHLDLLRRFTERVVFAFDADEAGAGASLRGFEHSVPGDLELRVALLPEGKDPADLVQAGELDLLRGAVEGSVPLLQFRLERELAAHNLDEPESRGRAVRAAAAVVARHPDAVVRHEYAVFVSRRTGVDLNVVERAVAAVAGRGRPAAEAPAAVVPAAASGQQRAERELLRILLANRIGVAEVDPVLIHDDLNRRAFRLLQPGLAALAPGEVPDLGALLGDDDSTPARLLRQLAMEERPLADPAEVLGRLRVELLDGQIERLRTELAGINPENDPQEYSHVFQQLLALEADKRRFSEE